MEAAMFAQTEFRLSSPERAVSLREEAARKGTRNFRDSAKNMGVSST